MRKKRIIALLLLAAAVYTQEPLQPYLLLGESGKPVAATVKDLSNSLFMSDFQVLGKYSPADTEDVVMIVSHKLLETAVRLGPPEAVYLSALHVAVTAKGEMTYISCQNPEYWGRAYYQDRYQKAHFMLEKCLKELKKSLPELRMTSGAGFGSESGLEAKDLPGFRFDMKRSPGIKDAIVLARCSDHNTAVVRLEEAVDAASNLSVVYRSQPTDSQFLIGVAWSGPLGEKSFMKEVDVYPRKHTAFLPLEVAVIGSEIVMLNPQYQFPLGFPDMSKRMVKRVNGIRDGLLAELGPELN